MPTFGERLKNGWNAFFNNRDPTEYMTASPYAVSSYTRPDRPRLSFGNDKSIVNAIYSRIAMDVASVDIRHVRLDENGRFKEEINSPLNNALTLDANIDQTGRSFIMDVVLSMFDEGCVAMVPVETKGDPFLSESYEIYTLRTGKIIQWYPDYVQLLVYNDKTGQKETIYMPKSLVAIVENPFYTIMNEPNSVFKRLIHKLNLLDAIDEQSSSGKLDLIIQLPYVIKTDAKREQAEKRRKDIEEQLSGSKYGIAYTDGTEHITQLNRAVENNMMGQIEYLTSMLNSQLGLTDEIMNGSANEEAMLNYYNRTVEVILNAIVDEANRKFLTKTARTQGQRIQYHRDPFKLTPVNSIAEIADKFTRNEILSSNEVRGLIGFKPVDDDRANELRNKNLNQASGQTYASTRNGRAPAMANPEIQNGQKPMTAEEVLAQLEAALSDIPS